MGAGNLCSRRSRRERQLAQETPVPTAGRIRVRGSRRRTGLYLGRRSQGEAGSAAGVEGIQVSHYTPRGLSRGPANIMVQLAGETVAEVMAKQGRITAAEKADIKAELQCAAGRDQARDPGPRGSGTGRLPGGLQRHQGSYQPEPDGAATGASRCHRRPLHPESRTGQRHQRAVPRRPDGVERPNFIRGLNRRSRSSTPASTTCTGTSGLRVPWRPRLNTQPRTPPTRCLRTRPSSAPAPRRSRAGSTSSATPTTRAEAAQR